MNLEQKFNLLKEELEKAGQQARDYFDSDDFSNEQKADGSIVTMVDKSIEKTIRNFIAKYFPDDSVVGEEDKNVEGTSNFVWHIDPIDGTDNFLRKIPFCAISVARLGDSNEDSFAIVHNPITRHTFSSLMEDGVYENERLGKLTAEPLGGKYVICTGLGRVDSWMLPARKHLRGALEERFGKSQSYGSTALELAYLSAGRVDGYITYGLHTYDYAGGLYLVRAGGGQISVFENGAWKVWDKSIKDLCDKHGRIIFCFPS
jgi:myo-inositol-1(or 4)-monophosphatase